METPNPNPTRIAHPEQSESPTKTLIPNHRCCFPFPCFTPATPSSSPSLWDHIRAGESDSKWWARPITAFKKLREWSEIVAGPRWKTFIRRFNRRHRNHHHHVTSSLPGGKFQYDPLSYALNFDDGNLNGQFDHDNDDDDRRQFPDFSSRFAAPVSSKSSMDLGRAGPDHLISV